MIWTVHDLQNRAILDSEDEDGPGLVAVIAQLKTWEGRALLDLVDGFTLALEGDDPVPWVMSLKVQIDLLGERAQVTAQAGSPADDATLWITFPIEAKVQKDRPLTFFPGLDPLWTFAQTYDLEELLWFLQKL